jgi:hypothetical protein
MVANPTNFELLITILQPPKRIRTSNRKTKLEKQEPLSFGPVNVTSNITWLEFLQLIAKTLQCQPNHLKTTLFEWHWLKPASSPWLPLQSEGGLISLLNKVTTKPEPYVIMRVQPPLDPDPAPALVSRLHSACVTETQPALALEPCP